jgi:hypothetical protein
MVVRARAVAGRQPDRVRVLARDGARAAPEQLGAAKTERPGRRAADVRTWPNVPDQVVEAVYAASVSGDAELAATVRRQAATALLDYAERQARTRPESAILPIRRSLALRDTARGWRAYRGLEASIPGL